MIADLPPWPADDSGADVVLSALWMTDQKERIRAWAAAGDLRSALFFAGSVTNDRADEALAVLAPFLADGSWPAAKVAAGVLARSGRAPAAVEMLQLHPESLIEPRATAPALVAAGRVEEAYEIVLSDPAGVDPGLAFVLAVESGRYDLAEHALRTAIDAGTETNALAAFNLSVVLLQLGRTDEAADYIRICEEHPDTYDDPIARGPRQRRLREFLEAARTFPVSADPLDPTIDTGTNAALEALEPLTDTDLGLPVEHFVLLCVDLGRHDLACEHAARHASRLLAVGDGEIFFQAYAAAGRLPDALRVVDAAIEQDPSPDDSLLLGRIDIMLALDRVEELLTEDLPPEGTQVVIDHLLDDRRYADALALRDRLGHTSVHSHAQLLILNDRTPEALALLAGHY